MAELSDQHERFCQEYCVDYSIKNAAIRAGYSEHSAQSQGSRLYKKVAIANRIAQIQADISRNLRISQEAILNELANIGFSDIANYFDKNNLLKDIHEIPEDARKAISHIEVFEVFSLKGDKLGDTKKVRLWNKKDALDSISRIKGYNSPDQLDIDIKKKPTWLTAKIPEMPEITEEGTAEIIG